MNLAQVQVSFPVLIIRTRVHYSMPRKPTALERVILRLCERFSANPTYNNIGLDRIFIDILTVADPEAVVLPTLHELLGLSVLRCEKDCSNLGHVAIRDLEVTERGREMLAKDMLPARPQSEEVEHGYDPVRQKLLSGPELKKIQFRRNSAAIGDTIFRDMYPEGEIRKAICEENYPWFKSSSEIIELERLETTTKWTEAYGDIFLHGRKLLVSFQDDLQSSYVNSLPVDELFGQVLHPALFGTLEEQIQIDCLPLADPTKQTHDKWMPLTQVGEDVPEDEKVWIIYEPSLVSIPETPPANRCYLVFDPNLKSDQISVYWNPEKNGAFVRIGMNFPIENGAVGGLQWVRRMYRVHIDDGYDGYEIPLANHQTNNESLPDVLGFLHGVSEFLIKSNDLEMALAPALWMSPEGYWNSLLEHLESMREKPLEALTRLLNWSTQYFRATGLEAVPDWDSYVGRLLRASVAHLETDLIEQQMESVTYLLGQCGLTSHQVKADSLLLLANHTTTPSGLESLAKLSKSLRIVDSLFLLPYPGRWYSSAVVREIFKEFGKPIIDRVLIHGNNFEQKVLSLHRLEKSLATTFGIESLTSGDSGSYHSYLRKADTRTCCELIREWESLYGALIECHPEIVSHLDSSALDYINRHIAGINILLRNFVSKVDPRFSEVLVIDTSVFIDTPDLLDKLRLDQYVVVSKRVIEELDDNKRDGNLRSRIAEATRKLNAFAPDRISFCNADLSLLPPDYRTKGDNLILSVAIKYKSCGPILLTHDNNLALKAKAENILTMRVEDLLRRTDYLEQGRTTNPSQFVGNPTRNGN